MGCGYGLNERGLAALGSGYGLNERGLAALGCGYGLNEENGFRANDELGDLPEGFRFLNVRVRLTVRVFLSYLGARFDCPVCGFKRTI